MLHFARRCLAVVALSFALPFSTVAQASPPLFVEGVVLVGFKPDIPEVARAEARAAVGASRSEGLTRLDRTAEKLTLRPGLSVPQAIKALLRNPNVRYAEPDYILTRSAMSNDSYFTNGGLWGMYGSSTSPSNAFGSNAAAAWSAGHTGSRRVYVGVIDEGIQVTHPDLAANVWVNPHDPVDGIDNDGNGLIDDVHGWDFAGNNASVYDGSSSAPNVDAHGTHVSGTIGGVGGNGLGVAGVNWQVTLISGKFLGTNGGSTSNAVRAVDYFTDLKTRHGLNIVATSNSWGGGGFSQALLDAINRGGDRGILFVAAAGNATTNIDSSPSYPAAYRCTTATRAWDCIISVASITSTGGLSSFSNYGATNVDIGAPGSGVVSAVPFDSYASYNGTSMATPHVTGAAALCASVNATLTAPQIRAAIIDSTVPTASLAGKTVTGGRLDVGAMISACLPSTKSVSGTPGALSVTAIASSALVLSWADGVSDESYYEVQRGDASCANFATIAQLPGNATTHTDTGLQAATTHCYRVRAGNSFPSASSWSGTALGKTLAPPPPYTCSPTSYQWLSPSVSTLALDDDAQATVSLPFAFPFYADTAASLVVGSNGYIRLDGGAATAHVNVAIAGTAQPNGFIAPFWDDLNPGAGGTVGTGTLGTPGSRQFVVSWENVPHYSVSGSALSFQVVLDEATGDFLLNYRDVIAGSAAYDRGASATVGVENPQGTAGTSVSYNSATLVDGSAYRCSTSSTPSVPATPSLGIASVAWNAVGLGWADVAGEEGYTLERSSDAANWSLIATLPAGTASHADAAVSPAATYHYRLRAFNGTGPSGYSAVVSATTPVQPPAAPTSLTGSAVSSTAVSLAWVDNAMNETGYEVERSSNAGASYSRVAILAAGATAHSDTGLTASTAYRYRVRAMNGTVASSYSNAIDVTTQAAPAPAPAAPTNVSAKVATDRVTVNVSWRDRSSNETGFEIGRAPSSAPSSITVVGAVGPNVAKYAEKPGVGSYVYFVRSRNLGGTSPWAGPSGAVTAR